MKNHSPPNHAFGRLLAVSLLAFATTSSWAAVAINGVLDTRPLSPQDIKDYSLAGKQGASGLGTVPVGQPAYLEADVNIALPDVTNVVWTLTGKPPGSAATLATSPLGNNVPVYKIADRTTLKVASRQMLMVDATGQYTVTAVIQTATNGNATVSKTITGAKYMGADTCALCHYTGAIVVPPEMQKYEAWAQSPHASKFARDIDGGEDPATSHFSKNCISCHAVGYNTDTNAVNDGFDDIATQLNWQFPTNLVPGNWASMQSNYPTLANLANIQCENCHGPGSEHAYSLGRKTNSISVSWSAGDCAQCHDSKTKHYRVAEWSVSGHARTTRTPSGSNRAACVRCHTANGFAEYANAVSAGVPYTTNGVTTTYEAINCSTCHDPHDASNPHQLRANESVLLADGVTTVTNAGSGAFCMNCHRSRNGSVTNSIEKFPLIQQTWAGGSAFGVHDNPASDMLEGVNGWTYGKVIPSSAHALSVSNTCVGCHMQTVAATDPAFLQAGGHTFNMTYTNGSGATIDKVDVCVKCHGQVGSFDMVKVDYNGDGLIEGVQTEVQKLMNQLSTMLPGSAYRADGNYIADGLVKSSVSAKTNWQSKFLKAGYNLQFVANDLSKGVHNTAYAVGLLKASIADLSGVSVPGGLPDWWTSLYFGSPTNALAGPNVSAAGDGVPNWMKYALGINPLLPGQSLTNGVVWNNVTALGGETNTVHIYTAAEVAFDTEIGKSYQIQGVSSLSGGWQNIGSPVAGTGGSVSLVTPTRNNVQQYFRVVHTP